MRVTTSAPGKVVLLGEYAVLAGAPALVAAVDRRARVTLTTTAGDGYTIDAPSLGIVGAEARLSAAGQVEWAGGTDSTDRLGLVTSVIQAVAESGAPPAFHAELDTDDFFASGGTKLGLGSSAALTVALAGAVFTAAGRQVPTADWLIDAHRRMQDGRGSGLDIAASLHGGVLIYQLGGESVGAASVRLPPEIEWCCVWSGKSASTGDFLRRIAQWREREPSRYAVLMAGLTETAGTGAAAVRRGDGAALLAAVTSYAELLAQFGAASDSDIVSREHREISAAAAASGVRYKTCGAGGGDIGIALAANVGKLADFRRLIGQAGFRALDLAVDPQGLSVRVTNE